MSMVAKILILVNLILAVMVMGAAGAYLQSAENWKKMDTDNQAKNKAVIAELSDNLQKTQASRDESNRKAAAAESARAAAEGQSRTLGENNAMLQKQMASHGSTLADLAARLKDLDANLTAANQTNTTLQNEKKQAEDEKRSALEAKNAAETEQKRLSNEIANLTAGLDASQKQMAATSESLESVTATLAIYKSMYPSPGATAAPVKGVVLGARDNVYLISIGSKDGLKTADKLTIFRGDKFIANVVVDKVMEDKASVVVDRIGDSPSMAKGMQIQQGDKVATIY